jgi:hypothetical protein
MRDIVMKLLLLLAVLALGCRDSKKQQADQTKGQASTPTATQDPAWIDRLPEVATADAKVMLETTVGIVGIQQDGSIVVARPPATAAADPRSVTTDPLAGATPVQLATLTKTLGIAPAPPRAESAYAPAAGSGDDAVHPIDAQYGRLGHPSQASGAPAPPKRATNVFALVHGNDVSAGVIVLADARAPAAVLLDVLAQTGGFLAARKGRELTAVPLAFDRQAPAAVAPDKPWTEVRLGSPIEIETVPSAATRVPAVDKLADAVKQPALDVLVAPTTTIQDLVATVGHLRAAKVEAIGFGRAPEPQSAQAGARGEHGPRVLAWDFAVQGPGDTAALRAAFDGALEPIRTCYAKELAKSPQLAATARVQFLIPERKPVVAIDVRDAPRPLATCITTAVKAVKFPAPGSAAGMNVMATVSFLPK